MPRVMTDHLSRVLAGLSESERRAILRIAETVDDTLPLHRIVRAVATELRVRQLAEDELFMGLERDRLEEMDGLHAGWPLPVPDGSIRLTFDPETCEVRPDSGPA